MMKNYETTLTAADGHTLNMYVAEPDGTPKGAIIVLQEIFGVNAHIRSVCDRLAQLGYTAGAPALFDRQHQGYESDYTAQDVQRGIAILNGFNFDTALDDIDAAATAFKHCGKVGIIGFCIGGSLAYKMATRGSVNAAACYYGSLISEYADDAPKCPTVLHYGETDPTISAQNVKTVRAKQPDLPAFVYPAGHGFNCDARSAFEPESAKLAWERTMDMIDKALAI